MVCIKFRAWNLEDSKMEYNVEQTYDYGVHGEGCNSDCFGTILKDDNYIVMQYIGLDDINGKPIYECDKIRAEYPHGRINGTVVFDNAAFVLKTDDWLYTFSELEDMDAELEVIGNIYEVEYERIS